MDYMNELRNVENNDLVSTAHIEADKVVVDSTQQEAFVVRQNQVGEDVLTVDTLNSLMTLTGDLIVSGNITSATGSIDLSDLQADLDGFPDELKNLTTAEINQLENIGESTTITSTHWGYVGNLDQDLITTSDVNFNDLSLTGNLTVNGTTTTLNSTEIDLVDTFPVCNSNNVADITDSGLLTKWVSGGVDYYGGVVRNASVKDYYLVTDQTGPGSIDYTKMGDLRLERVFTSDLDANGTTTLGYTEIDQVVTPSLQHINDASNSIIYVRSGGNLTSGIQCFEDSGLNGAKIAYNGSNNNLEISRIDGGSESTVMSIARSSGNVNFNSNAITGVSSLNGITSTELSQLENIDSSTISTAQWGYLGEMNQSVSATGPIQTTELSVYHGSDDEGLNISIDHSDANTSSRIFHKEDTASLYGFSTIYAGDTDPTFNGTSFTLPTNHLYLIRHNNNAVGSVVYSINRATGNMDFNGNSLENISSLNTISSTELSQLENIDSTTISTAQWGYLGNLDQPLTTTDSPTFSEITATSTVNLPSDLDTYTQKTFQEPGEGGDGEANIVTMRAGNGIEKWLRFRRGGSPSTNCGIILTAFTSSHFYLVNDGNFSLYYNSLAESDANLRISNATQIFQVETDGTLRISGGIDMNSNPITEATTINGYTVPNQVLLTTSDVTFGSCEITDSSTSSVYLNVENTNSGSGAYSIIRVKNNNNKNTVLLQNSTTRTTDVGAEGFLLKNTAVNGDLAFYNNNDKGLYIDTSESSVKLASSTTLDLNSNNITNCPSITQTGTTPVINWADVSGGTKGTIQIGGATGVTIDASKNVLTYGPGLDVGYNVSGEDTGLGWFSGTTQVGIFGYDYSADQNVFYSIGKPFKLYTSSADDLVLATSGTNGLTVDGSTQDTTVHQDLTISGEITHSPVWNNGTTGQRPMWRSQEYYLPNLTTAGIVPSRYTFGNSATMNKMMLERANITLTHVAIFGDSDADETQLIRIDLGLSGVALSKRVIIDTSNFGTNTESLELFETYDFSGTETYLGSSLALGNSAGDYLELISAKSASSTLSQDFVFYFVGYY